MTLEREGCMMSTQGGHASEEHGMKETSKELGWAKEANIFFSIQTVWG